MPELLQIDCVSQDPRLDPYERILRVGGPNSPDVPAPDASVLAMRLRQRGFSIANGSRWSLPLDDAIRGVLAGRWTFFVQYGGRETVTLDVATAPSGRLYLKASVDADTPDQLLLLPDCA